MFTDPATPQSAQLRGWKKRLYRVGDDEPFSPALQALFARWWTMTDILLWLQREYLKETFRGHDPTSEHEEETPVDLDHIQPANASNIHGNTRGWFAVPP